MKQNAIKLDIYIAISIVTLLFNRVFISRFNNQQIELNIRCEMSLTIEEKSIQVPAIDNQIVEGQCFLGNRKCHDELVIFVKRDIFYTNC